MRSRRLPARTRAEVIEAIPALRQSLLGEFDSCRLLTRFGLEGVAFDNSAQARGVLFHRFAGEVLRTLWRTGEVEMPTEEAMAILYEVVAQRDVPDADVIWIPAKERRLLRKCAIALVFDRDKGPHGKPRQFNVGRLMAVEERLFTTLRYPDPDGGTVERVFSGKPDAVIADPPDGVVVLDWKTNRQPPPKGDLDDHHDDSEHVSYLGYFQQRSYGLLAMRRWPHVQSVRLREFYVLANEARYATIYRDDLEHIERELTDLAEMVDRALMGGHDSKLWKPQPGKHCGYCPRPTQCPIEADVRAFQNGGVGGGIGSQAQAERLSGEALVAKQVYTSLMPALKAWVDVHDAPLPVKSAKGRAEWRWRTNKGGGRTFGVFVPEASDRGPDDPSLASAFAEAAERVKAAR